jgi:hypothetical protein
MNLSCQLHFNQCYYPVVFSYLKTKIMEGFKTIIEPFRIKMVEATKIDNC